MPQGDDAHALQPATRRGASVGFQATQTTELGDAVGLSGTNRTLSSMKVLLSSWGCQTGAWETGDCSTTPGATFDVPITFTVYDSTGTTVLAAKTQDVAVAYRPSASAQCTDDDAGQVVQPQRQDLLQRLPAGRHDEHVGIGEAA